MDVGLFEDNGGGLYLVIGDRVFAGVEKCIGEDAFEMMNELWMTNGAVDWNGIEEYSRIAEPEMLTHPETRCVAIFTIRGLEVADWLGNAAQAFLGRYVKGTLNND